MLAKYQNIYSLTPSGGATLWHTEQLNKGCTLQKLQTFPKQRPQNVFTHATALLNIVIGIGLTVCQMGQDTRHQLT